MIAWNAFQSIKLFFFCIADLSCPEAGSIFHHGRCYLIAPYPEISWLEANRMCKSVQVNSFYPPIYDNTDLFHEQKNPKHFNSKTDHIFSPLIW